MTRKPLEEESSTIIDVHEIIDPDCEEHKSQRKEIEDMLKNKHHIEESL